MDFNKWGVSFRVFVTLCLAAVTHRTCMAPLRHSNFHQLLLCHQIWQTLLSSMRTASQPILHVLSDSWSRAKGCWLPCVQTASLRRYNAVHKLLDMHSGTREELITAIQRHWALQV